MSQEMLPAMIARARGTRIDGSPLEAGVNVDLVDVDAGCRFAAELGYSSHQDQMVVSYALWRWGRGEEDGAVATWRSYFPRDLTTWTMILAAALAGAHVDR